MRFRKAVINDPRFDAAWRAFAEEDAQLVAPPDLEARTLDALRARRLQKAVPRERHIVAALSLAAGVMLTVVLSWPQVERVPEASPLEARAWAHGSVLEAYRPQVVSASLVVQTPIDKQRFASTEPADTDLPPALMNLDADPLRASEPIQLVRLRLPREALQGLGLVLLEPDAQGVVDIDVLVGEDGLPRDIRQVRTGQE